MVPQEAVRSCIPNDLPIGVRQGVLLDAKAFCRLG